MRAAKIAAVACALLPAAVCAQDLPDVTAQPGACSGLKALNVPGIRITEVVDVQDVVQPGDNVRGPHCRVTGVAGRSAAFVVVLPNRWNQRLLMGGNGGFAGTFNRAILAYSSLGFLTVTTNTGHDASPGGGGRWALNDSVAKADFAYAAVHTSVEAGKALAQAFYGRKPKYSYFTGCSNGGRQALMEVQRYPDDFDGVGAAAPALEFGLAGAAMFRDFTTLFPTPASFDHPLLTQETLDLLSSSELAACDALDGVTDGVIDDPRDCKFKLSSIKACPGNTPEKDCLTDAQRSAIATLQSPLRDENGKAVYAGLLPGGENLPGAWETWVTGRDSALMRQLGVPNLYAMFATEGAKYIAFSDSSWDYSRYRGNFMRDSRVRWAAYDANDTNIGRFLGHGGKLLMWHGWADPALNPLTTIAYYDKVLQQNAGARDAVRLFMVPGVLHCGGGAGITLTDRQFLDAITAWVEKGQAPSRLVATKRDQSRQSVRSRPLCAYPAKAVYSGSGSTDDAANFVCKPSS